jgi:hypothetical protein
MRGLSLLVQIQPLHWCDSPNLTGRAAVIVAPQPLSGHAWLFRTSKGKTKAFSCPAATASNWVCRLAVKMTVAPLFKACVANAAGCPN